MRRSTRCILSKFYIKPQQFREAHWEFFVVSYRNSTSNHNIHCRYIDFRRVVSYRNSTSNHNLAIISLTSGRLYLIEILHQTTTVLCAQKSKYSCILSKFYIKPQLTGRTLNGFDVVSYRNSTSNHNSGCDPSSPLYVVSYRNSTSNHNNFEKRTGNFFVVSYRNSTSNHNEIDFRVKLFTVVSYRNSTSNHNIMRVLHDKFKVVSYRNSTSNHNVGVVVRISEELYLIEILHQTTT